MKFLNNKVVFTSSPYNHKHLEVWRSRCIAKNNCQPSNLLSAYPRKFCETKFAFTLAEVLIALVVIGVIAAITLPIIVSSVQERAMSMRQVNIVRKVTEATNQIRAAGELTQFDTTMDFVNVLKKYLKITKICDSNHIDECWPTKTITDQKGKEYEVAEAKTRGDLGFNNDKNVPNVGIVLADGATLIMTYNPSHKGMGLGDQLISSNIDLPVGMGRTENFSYTTNSTEGLDFVFDVNGGKGPNSETLENTTKLKDIRNLNLAHFGSGCKGTKVNGKCYFWAKSIPTPIDCSTESRTNAKPDSDVAKYCPNTTADEYNVSYDKWAGANKYCKENDGELMVFNKLVTLCNTYGSAKGDGQIPLSSDNFWMTSYDDNKAPFIYFGTCGTGRTARSSNNFAFCEGN